MGVLARMALVPLIGPRAPFAIGFVIVVCAAILGGWRTGLVATFVGQILAWYLIYEPVYSFKISNAGDGWTILVATVCQLAVVTAVALYQREIGRQQEAREILVAELNHRVKNTLSVVQSLAQQTFRTGTKTPHFSSSAFKPLLVPTTFSLATTGPIPSLKNSFGKLFILSGSQMPAYRSVGQR
jgi:K+-sensing histidine kinase KdpD